MVRSKINIAYAIALLAGLTACFQNCSANKIGTGTSMESSKSGTNGGFDGDQPSGSQSNSGGAVASKTFVHYGRCGQNPRAIDTMVDLSDDRTVAMITRSHCVDTDGPLANQIASFDISSLSLGVLVNVASDMILQAAPGDLTAPPARTVLVVCAPRKPVAGAANFTIWSATDSPADYNADIALAPIRTLAVQKTKIDGNWTFEDETKDFVFTASKDGCSLQQPVSADVICYSEDPALIPYPAHGPAIANSVLTPEHR